VLPLNWEMDLLAKVELFAADVVPTPDWLAVTESVPVNETGPCVWMSTAFAGEIVSAATATLAHKAEARSPRLE